MNFQNLPAQLIILLCGWSFTLYLDRRAKHRAEAIKRKDYIVSKIEDIADWLNSEISKENFHHARTETSLAGMITQIELKMVQFNAHVRLELLDPSRLSTLRDVDLDPPPKTVSINLKSLNTLKLRQKLSEDSKPDLSVIYYEMRELSSDLIEEIESNCNNYFFPAGRFPALPESWPQHVASLVFGALISIALLCLYDLMHNGTTFTRPIYEFFTEKKEPPAIKP
ncbi:hypothetical protein BSG18_46450 [Pseudomonas ogarae]|uniref:hypothetical protein n=1 Tax=Pseudomonas ogarae (strain DSM 112162 / CECT 30235 / F113) TaxID=1114970 RepID=UPI000BB3A659|nr:hypothetical protein [Pseudomonas ogarae]PBJ18329.1 hypothetical protein BSG18_46450 [Pseudomonas ogarae]